MKTILITLCSLLLLNSCAIYSRKNKKYHQKLEAKNLSELEGTYEVIPHKRFFRDSVAILSDNKHNYYRLYKSLAFNDTKVDSTAHYTVRIHDVEKDRLSCSLMKNDSVVSTRSIEGELKSNGTFHFEEQELHVFGLPFILGSVQHSKIRIGLSMDNQLYVETAKFSGGGFLIIIFGGWRNDSFTVGYDRLKPSHNSKIIR